MNENQQKNSAQDIPEEEYHKEPKQNYVIYTIISILLFAVLYLGVQFTKHMIFRDYTITVNGESITTGQLEIISEYTEFDFENIEQMILTRDNNNFSAEILYNMGTYNSFAEDHENYVESDAGEDFRISVYPYGNSVPEYVYSRFFVNADDPNLSCYFYEYDGENYVKLILEDVPESIRLIFSDHEKNYRQ
ncbi:MAG: hypothetical protein ACI4SF_01230 [Oscillospiraceae bacterium]